MEFANFIIFGFTLIFTGVLVSFIYPGEQTYFFVFAGLTIAVGIFRFFQNLKNKKADKQ